MDKMTDAQKVAYIEAHAVMQQQMAHAASLQQQQQTHTVKLEYVTPLKVPQVPQPGQQKQDAHTFTMVADDGLGYDDGVRVLRSIGTWWALILYGNSVLIHYFCCTC